MKQITEKHFCDYCGVEINNYVPVAISPTFENKQYPDMVFEIRLGTACNHYRGSEFCSPVCFVLDVSRAVGVKPKSYSDDEIEV